VPPESVKATLPLSVPLVECRRFLHTNYNCRDLAGLEGWYTRVLDLKPVMRTSGTGTSAEAFGIYEPTSSETVFLYDHRGGRQATSVELVHWLSPPTSGLPYPFAWNHGIQSLGFAVGDIDWIAARAQDEGGRIMRRTAQAVLVRDPEGVAVELVGAGTDRPEAHHVRVVCADVERSVAWYEQIGMAAVGDDGATPGFDLWEGDGDHELTREVAMTATDDPTFSLILSGWTGPAPAGPSYAMPFHQGLYRLAIAVDDVSAAYRALRDVGVARQPPYTFALPGTPLSGGLTILFIRDPDGVLVELVERPRSHFRRD
jgi:catechol 2,3-dioxygenase-like lactoylglutathione lyase family enzyme